MLNRIIATAALTALASSALAQQVAPPETESDAAHHYFHATESAHAAEWGYTGEIGPEHWADLSPDYSVARSGNQQSPIDIKSEFVKPLPKIKFHYQPAPVRMVYNGHTIEEEEEAGSSISVGETRYDLKQFHFHSPSEHTVDGKSFAMEMHLVHKTEGGQVAVVAVLIDEVDASNESFEVLLDRLPNKSTPRTESNRQIDATAVLPKDHAYFAYDGSFTTPPCTEGVKWFVLQKPIGLSKEQIDEFRKTIDGNNRPVQPRHGRAVHRSAQ